MHTLREFAESLATRAGAILREHQGKVHRVEYKGEIDLVTEVDRLSEEFIRREISERFPDHEILGEEEGLSASGSEFRWIVDPIDGTTNYAHGFPYYCVSIGLERGGELVAGAIYNPVLDELYSAHKGGGATMNGSPIRVSKVDTVMRSLLTTGFPYSVRQAGDNFEEFRRFVLASQAVRRAGSAALDLCCVAIGRYDGFWEPGLSPWDIAAGALIVQEAGGQVTSYGGEPLDIYAREILATNGLLHGPMQDILRAARAARHVEARD